MDQKDIETFCPTSKTEWRKWLEKNHQSKQFVWLIYYKKSTKVTSISWSDAVDEALCFGWIDSTKRTIDTERYMQYFNKRKPKSNWSKINKDKIAKLILYKQMTEAGFESIKTAKENGSWVLLDDVENLIIPEDLGTALNKSKNSMDFFLSLSKSKRKILLYWVMSGKRVETRNKRIAEITQSASKGEMPKQFR